ncbi:MAG: hypothetical protein ACTII7_11925 [Galactobacter sp.]
MAEEAVATGYETTIGGDLALSITGNQVDLAVNNPHGDTVTTIALTGNTAGSGISSWASYDEYGNQETEATPETGATTYAWHGADQRALNPDTGLTPMGARLYNPIPGGNTTAYTYPQDPVNLQDVSGEYWTLIWRGGKAVYKWVIKPVWKWGKKKFSKPKKIVENQGRPCCA